MPDLGNFSDRNRDRGRPQRPGHVNQRPASPVPARREPPSRDRCPAGWDEGTWHLTLLFEQYARADDIRLRAGRPVIYADLDAMVRDTGSRRRLFAHETEPCTRRLLPADRADRCWYHWPPHEPLKQVKRDLSWTEAVEVIMAEFWSRVWDEHALDYLRRYFPEYGHGMIRHWSSLWTLQRIAERPVVRPPVMRRQLASVTMLPGAREE